jgi:multimeric flavodoxin WrbA
MFVLGIVGSGRKNGRTAELMEAALDGAEAQGARTQQIYLADYELRYHLGVAAEGAPYCPNTLADLCAEAEAIVLGSPVYYGDINGLTRSFMDSVPLPNANGKPALGFAIAGGSGKGLLSGVQSIYHFFYHRQMRAIDPTPVSRFNMEAARGSLHESGAALVERFGTVAPFPGEARSDRWADVLAYYASLPYFTAGPVDEFVMLAEQLIRISEGPEVAKAKAALGQALDLIREGEPSRAAPYAVRAYEMLYF